jgi:hypothetical protein
MTQHQKIEKNMNATTSLFISTYNVKLKIIIYLYCQTYKLTLKTKFIKYLAAKAALHLRVISEQEEMVPNVISPRKEKKTRTHTLQFIGLVYQGKDIVFRCIIEYSNLRDFGP